MASPAEPLLPHGGGGATPAVSLASNLANTMHKNWLLKRTKRCRGCVFVKTGVLMEILLPTAIFVGLIGVWKAVDEESHDAQLFRVPIDARGFFNGEPSAAPPCGWGETVGEWTSSKEGEVPGIVGMVEGLAAALNVNVSEVGGLCANQARSAKCRMSETPPAGTPQEVQDLPWCGPPCGPTNSLPDMLEGTFCHHPSACLGEMCLRITPAAYGVFTNGLVEQAMVFCMPFILYPFTYNNIFGDDVLGPDGQSCGFTAAPLTAPDFDTIAILRHFHEVNGDTYPTDLIGDVIKTGYRFGIVIQGGPRADEQVETARQLHAYMMEPGHGTYTYRYLEGSGDDVLLRVNGSATDNLRTDGEAMGSIKGHLSQKVFGVINIMCPGDPRCGGAGGDGKLAYDIRMNYTSMPTTEQINTLFVSSSLNTDFEMYYKGGFTTLQQLMDDFLLRDAGVTVPAPALLAPMPLVSYTENPFLSLVGGFLAFFMALVMLYPVSQLTSNIVREKEQRIREVMFIMGLSPAAFRLSWFCTSALQMLLATIIGAFVLKISYLAKSDYWIVLILLTLYFWSITALGMLIASFFSKALMASIAGPVIFFATVIIGTLVPQDASSGLMNLASVFSTYPFTQGMMLVSNYEAAKIGIKWEHLYDDKLYSLSTALLWLVGDIGLYIFLAWYVDNVLPQEWGVAQHPLFFFMPSYWCPKQTAARNTTVTRSRSRGQSRLSRTGKTTNNMDRFIEEIPAAVMANRQVAIQGLRKQFKADDGSINVAVNDINLDLMEGQIQVLLGHNGAGKTTAINMLTGLLPIDGGDAWIYDNSCKTQMPVIRSNIGLCPQHNVLWDTLTCAEHLRYFARLKGVAAAGLEGEVDTMLEKIDLADKKDVASASLSGGMKRKLSVGIALIGPSRFVIFDEPTAGMDVQARRSIWDLLKQSKEGRTVLLTTHFMDEADLLGDSIAIMHKGKLPYWGSSLFLKSRLGVGYALKMTYEGKPGGQQQVQRLISEKIRVAAPQEVLVREREVGEPLVTEISNAGKELQYRLPMWATRCFGDLFRELEGPAAAELGIVDYGVSVTTLEEIFLKIAQDDVDDEDAAASDEDDASPAGSPHNVGAAGVGEKAGLLSEQPARRAHAWQCDPSTLMRDKELYRSQWNGLLRKRFNNYKRDKCLLCCQLLLPVLLIMLACSIDQIPTNDPRKISIVGYSDCCDTDRSRFPVAPGDDAFFDAAVFDDSTFLVEKQDNYTDAELEQFNIWLLDSFNSRKVDDHRYQAFFLRADNRSGVFHNASNHHAMPVALNSVSTALLRNHTGDDTARIDARNAPFPLSDFRKNVLEGVQTVSKTGTITAPFTFVPSVFVGFIVMERMRKAKLVQLVSGVKLSAYWLSNFVFDMMLYCITIFLGVLVLAGFDRDEYVSAKEGHLPATILLLLSYGLAAIGISYLFSFMFQSHTTAQLVMLLGNFFPAMILLTVTTILQIIDSTRKVGEGLLWVFRLFPAFALGEGLQALALRQLYSSLGFGNTGPFAACNGYGCNGVMTPVIYLLAEVPVIYALILLKEKPELMYNIGLKKKYVEIPDAESARSMKSVRQSVPGGEDEDVRRERTEVDAGNRDDDLVVVKQLMHEYPAQGGNPPKRAVKGMSFAVPKAEIFGFLGTNGAGKTTTMSVMAGEFAPTHGTITIAGHDILSDTQAARQQIGYCPQFDALLDLLTPRETIDFYCALRGVPHEDRKAVTDSLLKDLGVTKHQFTRCKALSGGNKRKTSICISLVGGPLVVLLDEPTAGMDPSARRTLWDALKRIGAGRCVVLTTHHLEEVEALAQRCGIMVDGQLDCLGSLQHLKDKFGKGYAMEVKLQDEEAAVGMKDFIAREFAGHAELFEEAGLRLTFQLPRGGAEGGRPLSQIFDLIEQNRAHLRWVDYAITQTSLEQVFMAICRRHLETEDAENQAKQAKQEQQPEPSGIVGLAQRLSSTRSIGSAH